MAQTWEKPPPPPYSILYASSQGPHPNGFLSWDSQVGVPKFTQLRFSQLWGCITSRADLQFWWGPKKSCNPRQELSNDISHTAWTLRNWVDSRLLVVKNQIASLSPDLSFDHNLCFKYWNGRCEPDLDI
jgi:hypothetical protein